MIPGILKFKYFFIDDLYNNNKESENDVSLK